MKYRYFKTCIRVSIVYLLLVSALLSLPVSARTDAKKLSEKKLIIALTAWAVDLKINTRQLAARFKPKIASIWSDKFIDIGSVRNLKELKVRELSLQRLEKLTKNYRLAIHVVYSNNEKLLLRMIPIPDQHKDALNAIKQVAPLAQKSLSLRIKMYHTLSEIYRKLLKSSRKFQFDKDGITITEDALMAQVNKGIGKVNKLIMLQHQVQDMISKSGNNK